MNLLIAALIGAVTLNTEWQDVPDTNTVGSVLNLGHYNATNAANWAIGRYDSTNLSSRISAKYTKPDTGIPMTDLKSDLQQTIYGKQDALVSGTNIKTINNQSILGSGNITIESGSGGTSNYNLLSNKPKINNVELIGNKSLTDIGAQKIIADFTTTNAVCNLITNNVAEWAMHGKAEPVTDLSPATNYTDIATNALAATIPVVASTDPTFTNAVLQTFADNIGTNAIAVLNEIGDLPITPGQTGASIAGLLAALAAAIAWLKKNKRDKTDNTCHATTSGFTSWMANLPTDHEWDDQPSFSTTANKWIWGSMSEDVEGDSTDPDATSVTFSYTVEEGTKTFTATRTANAQIATADKTYATNDYVDKKVGSFAPVGGVTPTVTSGVANLSTLFSSDNTSLTSTIGSTIASRCASLDPATSSIADIINALKGN